MTRPVVGIARGALRVMLLAGIALGPVAASANAGSPSVHDPSHDVRAAPLGCSAADLPLRIGASGQCVRYVQGALQILGFSVGPSGADGGFGPDTQAAIQAWQAATGRAVTGEIADMEELALLVSMTESGEGDSGEDPAPPAEPVTGFPLQVGSSGDSVLRAQGWLVALGFGVGSSGADGHFGPDTQAAVQAWQAATGRPVTGVITSEEYGLLESAAAADPEPNVPTDLGDGLPLRVGSSGPRVAQLQQMLADLGFSPGSSGADGQFGPDTEAAVQAWQASAGHATDGVVTEAQFAELVAATTTPAAGPAAPPAAPAAPVPGEAHVLWSTSEHNTRTTVYDVVGGVATPIPGIDPMTGWAGYAAWSTDLATLYLTAAGQLRAIDLATLESNSVRVRRLQWAHRDGGRHRGDARVEQHRARVHTDARAGVHRFRPGVLRLAPGGCRLGGWRRGRRPARRGDVGAERSDGHRQDPTGRPRRLDVRIARRHERVRRVRDRAVGVTRGFRATCPGRRRRPSVPGEEARS